MRNRLFIVFLVVCASGCDGRSVEIEESLVPKGDSAWVWQLEFPENTDLTRATQVLEDRFHAAGIGDVMIELGPPSQLKLSISGVAEEGKDILLRLATIQGRVSFHIVDEDSSLLEEGYDALGSTDKEIVRLVRSSGLGAAMVSTDGAQLAAIADGIARRGADLAGRSIAIQPPNESDSKMPLFTAYVVLTRSEIDNGDIASATGQQRTDVPTVDLAFTESGAKRLTALTRDHLGGRIAILLDSTVLSAPVIRQVVENGSIQLRFGWGGRPEDVKLMAEVWAFFIELEPLPAAAVVIAEGA